MKLQEAVIAITGGAQGLGKAIALDLASKGGQLALIDLNIDSLEIAQRECKSLGAKTNIYQCNVANESEVESTFNEITSDFGRLDGLVNNAGILRDAMLIKAKDGEVIRKMSLNEWQSVIDVNLTGVFLCAREASTHMLKTEDDACIVNISSIARAGNVGQSNYSAAKAGVAAMTVTWAKELSRYNIRSMAVAPGFIETEMTGSMPDEVLAKMAKQIPLNRIGHPLHIAKTVAHIFENDYLSGRIIEVDGALRI